MALRFSTVGMGVLEGTSVGVAEGDGVSVKDSVGITDAVNVAVGAGGVDDFAGGFVAVGTEDDGKLQATKVHIQRVEKTRFRLIGENCIPFQKIVPNNSDVKVLLVKKYPRSEERGYSNKLRKETLLSLEIAASLVFFF